MTSHIVIIDLTYTYNVVDAKNIELENEIYVGILNFFFNSQIDFSKKDILKCPK